MSDPLYGKEASRDHFALFMDSGNINEDRFGNQMSLNWDGVNLSAIFRKGPKTIDPGEITSICSVLVLEA